MKNLTFVFFSVLCLAVCFSSCGDEETMEPDPVVIKELTIIPGQGIGDLRIGDLGSKVAGELGDDFELIVNEGGSGNATYNYLYDPKGIDVIFGQYSTGDLDINTLPIKSFTLFDDFDGMTDGGIKIGSTKAEVVAEYGEPDELDLWVNVYYIGLLISYNDLDEVRQITILEI